MEDFQCRLVTKIPSGKIPVDQIIEETIEEIKDTQTAGFSLKRGSVHKYYLTAEYKS